MAEIFPDGATQGRPRLYGRAKGRPLRDKQQHLMDTLYPKLIADESNLKRLNEFDDAWLEIGFGGAEHLIYQAAHNPKIAVIGAEPFINGVAKALTAIDADDMKNVFLYQGDGRHVIDRLPDGCLGRAFVLFPDPWPKARHNKRRIITEEFLADLHRLIRPGGIFRFGSDIIDYVDWTLTRVKKHGGFALAHEDYNWRVRPDDWPETRYEAKAHREGRPCHYFEFKRL